VLGYADLPEKPVRLEKWLIVPAHLDSSPIPTRTMQRIQSIYAAGLRPRGFVVVHEAPMALTAPRQGQPILGLPARAVQQLVAPKPLQAAMPTGSSSLSGLVKGLGTVLSSLVMVVFPMLFLGLLALDPIVVAVMDDGCWIEIDRWYTE
jgi:ABC-type microcin C transport system permease subunit YejE